MKSKKPVIRPTFLVKFWCVNLMFKFVLEKEFEFSFDSIICPFFVFNSGGRLFHKGTIFFEKAGTAFVNIIETALKKSVPKTKVFIRNDKSDITIHQKWKNKTRKLYREMNIRMKPTDDGYEVLQRNYLEQLNHDRIDHSQQTFSKLQTERNK